MSERLKKQMQEQAQEVFKITSGEYNKDFPEYSYEDLNAMLAQLAKELAQTVTDYWQGREELI